MWHEIMCCAHKLQIPTHRCKLERCSSPVWWMLQVFFVLACLMTKLLYFEYKICTKRKLCQRHFPDSVCLNIFVTRNVILNMNWSCSFTTRSYKGMDRIWTRKATKWKCWAARHEVQSPFIILESSAQEMGFVIRGTSLKAEKPYESHSNAVHAFQQHSTSSNA